MELKKLSLPSTLTYTIELIEFNENTIEEKTGDTAPPDLSEATYMFGCPELDFEFFTRLTHSDQVTFAQTSKVYDLEHLRICTSKLKPNCQKVADLRKQGMNDREIFLQHPDCRKDEFIPIDERGLAYLRSIHLGGPIRARQIANGELTIEKAQSIRDNAMKGVWVNLIQFPNHYRMNILGPAVYTIVHYIIDGSLPWHTATELSKEQIERLHTDGVRQLIDNRSITLKQALEGA